MPLGFNTATEGFNTATNLMVKDRLAALLREEIVSGQLQPGTRIVEGKWAQRLNVAQASVREALNILAGEGFVQKGSGRSARVAELSEDDVIQMFQVRAVLEGLGAKLVVEKQPDLSEVKQALADMRSAIQRSNLRAFYERDLRFHLLICEKSGNRYLAQELQRVLVPLFAFVLMRIHVVARDPRHWDMVMRQHEYMVEVLETTAPEAAEQKFIRQIDQIRADTHAVLVKARLRDRPDSAATPAADEAV